MIGALRAGRPTAEVANGFHDALAALVIDGAQRWAAAGGGPATVVLSGGCFQNRLLLERAVGGLREAGFAVHWHQRIPPNDGGVSLGQAVAACLAR